MFNKFTEEILEGTWFSTLGAEGVKTHIKSELLSHDITEEREEDLQGLLELL